MSQLQRDLKQNRPFKSLEEEAYLSLVRTAGQLTDELTAVLKPAGLSEVQYNVLRILRGAGAEGHACSEIGARLVTRDPDVTRLLDRLEKRGLVTRSREQTDRRVVTTRITDEGLTLLAQIDEPLHQAVQGLLGHLPRPAIEALLHTLDQARDPALRAAARAKGRRSDADSGS